MKKFIINFIVLCFILLASLKIYSQDITIDSIFRSSFELFPFGQIESISSMSIEGEVYLNTDTSLVRVLLADESGVQYMIFETYPLICPGMYVNFTSHCDETCLLEEVNPASIMIQVIDAKLNLKSFHYTTDKKENASEERYQAKRSIDAIKISVMNQSIPAYDMNWVAGDNSLIKKYYDQKRQMFGDGYNLKGYDYYDGGVFEFIGHRAYPKVNPNLVWNFDWRNRHGANDSASPYWDGDMLGTGWLTSVKDQKDCGSCWAFSAVGTTEAIANLYSGKHIDYDLSEQNLLCEGSGGSCEGGHNDIALAVIKNHGISTEFCFPYDTVYYDTCYFLVCNNPDTVINIEDTIVHFDGNEIKFDSIRKKLIEKGPLSVSYNSHEAVLSGFEFIPQDSTLFWIIKNSYDTTWGEKGFGKILLEKVNNVVEVVPPVFHNGKSIAPDTCVDLDHDNYYFWGIGKKPENCNCSDTADCDDNNPLLGGYDENYNCTCLVEYTYMPGNISEDTIWESNVYVNHDVIVDSGACLTIKSIARFSSGSNILVKKAGKLIIDGGTLTNACPETLWGGIVVYGSDTAQYSNQYFGVVNIINDGVIENARIGISTNYCPLCEQPNSSGGGIIRAERAIFRNNGIAVEFTPFRNIYQGYERPYMASFKNCLFQYTDYLQDYSDFKYFIKFNQVNGIRIQGCDFISDTLSIHPNKDKSLKYRSGIYSVGSQYYVEDACLSQSTPCTQYKTSHFRGLNYGIYALGIDGTKTVSVKKTFFDQNKTGIYLSAINYATIAQDTFEVVIDNIRKDTVCGLYLDYCTGYHVEENTFHGDYLYEEGHQPKIRVGTVINNSGEQSNEIYNNSFDSLFIGTLALNVNRSIKDKTIGLQILCNDYTNGFYDIAVTAQGHQNESGIADPQGSSGQFPTSPANNTFSYSWHNPESDYANDCQNIVYWHLKDTIPANTKPKYHSNPEVEPLYNGDYSQEYIKNTCCPSSFDLGGGGSVEELRLKITELTTKSDSVKSSLDLLVDGGDTYQMTMDIINSIPESAEETAEMLLSDSPYLSDSVMLTAVAKENVLTPAMITSVLYENPQAAKSDTIQQALDNREQLLTDEQRIYIDQGWFTIGAKEVLEANYSQFLREKTKAQNSLIRYFKSDTLMFNPIDSIIDHYLENNSIFYNYSLAFEYLNWGDTLNASEILSSIPLNFSLTNSELIQNQQYIDYFHVLISSGMYQAYNEIDTSVQESLLKIASSSKDEIKALARNILLSENIISYNEPLIFPDLSLKSNKFRKQYSKLAITENTLKLYPNPAMNYVIVEYSLTEPSTCQYIKILDMSGRICYDIAIHEPKGYMLIPIKDLSNGIYIFQLDQNISPVISKKLIISK